MCCSVRIANMRVYVPLYADIGSIETNIKSTRQTMRKNNRSVEMFLNTAHKRTDGIQRGVGRSHLSNELLKCEIYLGLLEKEESNRKADEHLICSFHRHSITLYYQARAGMSY